MISNRSCPTHVKTALLLGAMSALFLFLGEALGGAQGLVLGFVFAAVTNFGVVLVLRQDRPADVSARRKSGPSTGSTRSSAGWRSAPACRCRACYVIPQPSPNAFATGRNPEHAAVAATEGILRMLTTRSSKACSRTSWRTSSTATS